MHEPQPMAPRRALRRGAEDSAHPAQDNPIGLDVVFNHHLHRLVQAAGALRRLILVVELPHGLSRLSLYGTLEDHSRLWNGADQDSVALLDLSNHSSMPAQTIIDGQLDHWADLADGLGLALRTTRIVVVVGLEQMLQDTPARLAAYLEGFASTKAVIVLTHRASLLCQLRVRATSVHLDQSLVLESESALDAHWLARSAIAAARQGPGGALPNNAREQLR